MGASVWLTLLAIAHAEEDEATPARLLSIRWQGLHALQAAQLERHMLSVPMSWKFWIASTPFDVSSLQEDVERIRKTYRDHGYYDAEVEASVAWNREHTRGTATIRVDEGQPIRLSEIQIEWKDSSLPESLRKQATADLPARVGDVFGPSVYRRARKQLMETLADDSRPAARLEGGAEVDPERHSASVSWTLDPGPAVRFGPVTISGSTNFEEQLVRRELQFKSGDAYTRRAIEASEQAIDELGLFQSVMIRSDDPGDGSGVWPVVVQLQERSPRSVSGAVGYGTADRFRARIRWEHRNFFGGARRLVVTGKASSLVLGVDGRIEQRHFPDFRTRSSAYASFLRETPPAYDSKLALVGMLLERPFGERWKGFLGYRFEYGDVSNVVGDTDRSEGKSFLSYFRLSAQRSTLDVPLNPSRGTWWELALEPAGRAIGSDVDYVRMTAEVRAFVPLWKAVLAMRLLAGTLQPFGGSQAADIPVFKLFYSGGSSSVRGFRYQHLGPVGAQGEAEGGLTLGQGNVEIRLPLWKALSGVAFFDVGQVTRDPFKLESDEFLTSTGGGLRILTPVGDLRLDYGHLLNPPPNVDRGRFYISIGQAF